MDVQTSLNCSMKMPKSISLSLDLDSDGIRFLKWLKDSKEPWNTFNTTTTVSLSFLQPTISSLKALHRAECLVSRGQGKKLLAAVSATSSSFEMAEYRACTSTLIPTIRVRMRRGFDGVRTISGKTIPSKVRHLNSRAPNHAERNSDWHGAAQLSSISAAARLPTFLSFTSRPRSSSGLSSDNTLFICPECFRKAETMRSVPCGVRAT